MWLILLLVMTDSILQSPMFYPHPGALARLFPSYAPLRMLFGGTFSPAFAAGSELLLGLAWLATLSTAAFLVLRRRLHARTARS